MARAREAVAASLLLNAISTSRWKLPALRPRASLTTPRPHNPAPTMPTSEDSGTDPRKDPSPELREDILDLVAGWDPRNLIEKFMRPKDEYDPEVKRIVQRLEEAESPEKAARLLQDVMNQMFHPDFTTEECRPHGEKLMEVIESHRDRG